jgi:hypothetical protein
MTEVSAHQEQTRQLVGAMMKLTGLSASGLALAAGLTPSTVNRFMHRPVRHTLSQSTMLALMTETFLRLKNKMPRSIDQVALTDLAPAIAVYELGILEHAPDVGPVIAAAKGAIGANHVAAHIPSSGVAEDLPVLIGSSQGINVAAGDFSKAQLKTWRPPFLKDDAKAFAILMPDETMSPRFDVSDMLYVSPARSLEGGNVDVVLERAYGGFIVGSLAAITINSVRLRLFSPSSRESFNRDKIRGMYRVVGLQRLD